MNESLSPDPRTLDLDPTLPCVTWEFDIEDEEIGDVTLATLVFSSGAGHCSMSNFTPDALRAIADAMREHAHLMDGKGPAGETGLQRQLAKAIPYIGVPQYAVPDGLVDACERAAGIELPDDDQLQREFDKTPIPEDAA